MLEELAASIESSPVPFVITAPRLPDNPVVAVNASFLAMTLYPLSDVVGRNCRFLQGPDTDPSVRSAVRSAVSGGRTVLAEILNYRRDGTPFRNAMMIAPVLDEDGGVAFFLGSQIDLGVAEGLVERRRHARAAVDALPRRQAEVLRALAQGLRNRQIAAELGLSVETVKMHRARLMDRLGVVSLAEAVRIGIEAGLW